MCGAGVCGAGALARQVSNQNETMTQSLNDSMIPWLNLLGWVACIVYGTIPSFWLAIHPWANYWRSRKRSPYLFLLPAWIAMWIVLGLATSPWRHFALYKTPWSWAPALALFGVGFWLYAQSSKHFSAKQLAGLPELTGENRVGAGALTRPAERCSAISRQNPGKLSPDEGVRGYVIHREQRLITSGIRARVRHPVYLAHLCEMLAWSLGTGLVVCYGLTAFAVLTGTVMIRMEDEELEKRFGDEYAHYKKRVPSVLPRIG